MCFSIEWFLHLLIVLIVVCAVIAIMRIWVFPMLGSTDPRIVQTINIIIWVIVAIFLIYICFDLLECAFGGGLGFTGPGRLR